MCGIVGIVDAGGVSFPLYYALYALQHRGQESAGISTFEGTALYTHKASGLVAEVFNSHTLQGLRGNIGIGHVRYPTTGSKVPENVQPFNFRYQGLNLSIAHNGNLVNTAELREEYERRGQIFCTTSDTEIIGNIIADALRTSKGMEDAVRLCMRRLRGSYAAVALLNDTVYAFRDPLGIKPLCIGRLDQGYIVASESVAIDALDGTFVRDVRPGELVRIDEHGLSSVQIATANRKAYCIFEYIYFARADSVIDGTLVYDVRRRIGQQLYDAAPVDADTACPVPDSGIAYAAVALLNDTVYAFRDPLGIKPLCIGRLDRGYILASESVAIDALDGTFVRDVRPGELVRIDEHGLSSVQIATANRTAHCIFEYIYFARADSVIDGTLVYDVRRRIGQKLYDADPVVADTACPVPDSGIAYAAGYAERSGIPFVEGLMKNRYMGRTFIMPTQEQRERAVRIKLNIVRGNLKDKRVVLVDDSIVRGTTSRRIVNMIRDAGAKEIHLRVGSPPIVAPCYLGVDMPTRAELIASGRDIEGVRESIGATSLTYIPLGDLVEAIGCGEGNLCTGCLTGCYPVDIHGEKSCHCVVDYVAGTHQSDLSAFRAGKQQT